MRSRRPLCVLALFLTGSAAGADICQDIAALPDRVGEINLTLPNSSETPICRRSVTMSGGSQVHCGWAFAYRAAAAVEAFEQLVRIVADCLGETAQVTADQDVNHPDFYDLQTFQFAGQEIGVSLKDKAALSETYVFLRATLAK